MSGRGPPKLDPAASTVGRKLSAELKTKTPKWMTRFVILNGVPSDRRRFMAGKLYAESLRILTEKVSRRGMPYDIPAHLDSDPAGSCPRAEGAAQTY